MQLKKQTAIGIAETEEAAAVMKKYIAEKYALLEANIFICIVDPSADGAAEKIETFVNIEHEGTDLIFISEALDDMVRELGRTENIIHTDRKLFIPTADTKDEQANLSAFRDFLLRTSV